MKEKRTVEVALLVSIRDALQNEEFESPEVKQSLLELDEIISSAAGNTVVGDRWRTVLKHLFKAVTTEGIRKLFEAICG